MSGLSFAVRARRETFDLDVQVEDASSTLAVVGHSGAGKTTLLQALAGLVGGAEVRLSVGDQVVVDTAARLDPPAHVRGVGYVFQDGRLFPHLSVGENVAFGARYSDAPMSTAEALSLVELTGFESRRPRSLSGGEARRAALARALLPRPRLLLLDEPFTGLDAERRARLVGSLRRLRDELAVPLILVSHDARDVEQLTDRVVELRDGRLA
jgi:molybdate transport system ATP-binding protein